MAIFLLNECDRSHCSFLDSSDIVNSNLKRHPVASIVLAEYVTVLVALYTVI